VNEARGNHIKRGIMKATAQLVTTETKSQSNYYCTRNFSWSIHKNQ